jgi:hypothetical protein|tara:strand:- start:457 stop:660 length:204 start_codon:yes stop_codon:yes gene_type:complete
MQIIWVIDVPKLKVRAVDSPYYFMNESLMDPVQDWCWTNMPNAKRISFDTFQFDTEANMTWFLMKWG